MNKREKVAVVAIHGVGDPKAGDTAHSVARLLVMREGFQHEGRSEWMVPVHPVPHGLAGADQGLAFHDHLLQGTRLGEKDRVYVAQRHRLQGDDADLDVIDLHWGDLSGLQGAVTRIASELYTLGLRFSQLGRDAVRHFALAPGAPATSPALRTLVGAHRASAMVLTQPIVLLNVLLLAVALWWMTVVALKDKLPQYPVLQAGLGLVAIAALISCFYVGVRSRRTLVAVAAGAAFWAFYRWGADNSEPWIKPLGALGLAAVLLVAYVRFVRFYDRMVPGARVWSWILTPLLLAMVPIGYMRSSALGSPPGKFPNAAWAYVTANMMEFLLVFLILAWAVLGLAAAVTVVAGWRVRRLRGQGLEAARSIDTGRYGLYCSVSLFLILTVILWAVLLKPVLGSMEGLRYHSMLKPDQEVIVSALGQMHYTEVVRGATWIVAQVAVLLLLAVAVVLPSVLAELSPPEPGRDGSRLGRWLTQRGRHFALFASALAFWAALLFGVLVVLRLGGLVFEPAQQVYEVLVRLADQVGLERWLAEFGAGAHGGVAAAGLAGALLGVVSIGGRLFGPLARLHVPVDIALDVDNHFREFPAHATPRARISARLFSVLEAVADAGYDRVVIVAHSQGSVVAAELLRHLRLLQPAGWERMPEIRLFTCGCPLRQLYASRFPALYRWVETPLPGGAASGPQAAALGVSRWTNAYASGDYVGRWLWQAPGQDLLDSGAVYTDGVHRQLCLGKGAHTHYYDLQMAQVAHEIRLLVD